MKISGHGGFIVLGTLVPGPSAVDLVGTAIVHNMLYEIQAESETRETRSVGCGGWEESLHKFKRVDRASFRAFEDDGAFPELLGLTEGQEIYRVWLKRGELDRWDMLAYPIVKSVAVVNDQKKARVLEVVLHRGVLVRDAPPPVLPGA